MNKHTPGPWEFSHRKNKRGMYSTQVYTIDGEVVAEVAWYPKAISPTTTGTYREDNARLIAAAPDLLEASENALGVFIACTVPADGFDDRTSILDAQRQLRAAIAKATGAA